MRLNESSVAFFYYFKMLFLVRGSNEKWITRVVQTIYEIVFKYFKFRKTAIAVAAMRIEAPTIDVITMAFLERYLGASRFLILFALYKLKQVIENRDI